MNRISKNFVRKEFECQCGCGFDTVDAELLGILESVRKWAGAPVRVSSGCRCIPHNLDEGGTVDSQHLEGKASDIEVAGKSPSQVYHYIDSLVPNSCGLGLYSWGVHIDSRNEKARWTE